MRAMHAGSLGRRLARWLALLALAGLALTCLGVYTATSLSLGERQAETLRQKQLQVRHLVAETGVPSSGALKHKLDDALVGRQDLALVLADASEQVLYAGPAVPPGRRTLVTRFEVAAATGPVRATLTLDASEDDRVLGRLARTLVAAALAGSIVIAAGGFTLVQIGLRPVRDLAARIYNAVALRHHEKKEHAVAANLFVAAVRANPKEELYLYNLACAWSRAGDVRALDALKAAIGIGEAAAAKYLAVANLPVPVLAAFGDERVIPMSWGSSLSQALKNHPAAVLSAAEKLAQRKPLAAPEVALRTLIAAAAGKSGRSRGTSREESVRIGGRIPLKVGSSRNRIVLKLAHVDDSTQKLLREELKDWAENWLRKKLEGT